MKIRVKSKWNNKDRERTPTEVGSAIGFNLWRIAGANVLHMENEGYQTDTHHQRLDVIAELVAFFVHVIDRLLLKKEYSEDKRRDLVTALALNLAKTMKDNRLDAGGEKSDFSAEFIALLNTRMDEYAQFTFDGEQPGFQMRRRCGEHVRDVMGAKDNKWIPDQVMDIEIPDAMKVLSKIFKSLT